MLTDGLTIMDVLNGEQRIALNFINSHDLYQFVKDPLFRRAVSFRGNINMIDGFTISVYLSLKKFRVIRRFSGPDFTYSFFSENKFIGRKHLFIGFEKKDVDNLLTKFPSLLKKNIFYYNPPYIQEFLFPKEEITKITNLINSEKIDFVWVGLGCPKQNFLTEDLFKKTKTKYFFNVGAGLDFLLGKKKRSPSLFRKLGLEWFYRLITDFRHSRKKVGRSWAALKSLYLVDIK